jgi:hypothetical protein
VCSSEACRRALSANCLYSCACFTIDFPQNNLRECHEANTRTVSWFLSEQQIKFGLFGAARFAFGGPLALRAAS